MDLRFARPGIKVWPLQDSCNVKYALLWFPLVNLTPILFSSSVSRLPVCTGLPALHHSTGSTLQTSHTNQRWEIISVSLHTQWGHERSETTLKTWHLFFLQMQRCTEILAAENAIFVFWPKEVKIWAQKYMPPRHAPQCSALSTLDFGCGSVANGPCECSTHVPLMLFGTAKSRSNNVPTWHFYVVLYLFLFVIALLWVWDSRAGQL